MVLRHATSCPLARPSTNFKYVIVPDDEENVTDLTERGFDIRTCKCVKGA